MYTINRRILCLYPPHPTCLLGKPTMLWLFWKTLIVAISVHLSVVVRMAIGHYPVHIPKRQRSGSIEQWLLGHTPLSTFCRTLNLTVIAVGQLLPSCCLFYGQCGLCATTCTGNRFYSFLYFSFIRSVE